MANVTIFGTGNMGTAIADVLTAGGSTVDHIGHADPPGPVNGDIVILAVYYAALKDILAEYADEFAGKTVVDITNPANSRDVRLAAHATRKLLRCGTGGCAAVLSGDQSVQHDLRRHTQRKGRWAR
jgi:predicted dinucleotide-binding enzyme